MQIIILPGNWSPKFLDNSPETGMMGDCDILKAQLNLLDPGFVAREVKIGKKNSWIAILITLKGVLSQSYFPEDDIKQKTYLGKRIMSIISSSNAVLLDKEASKLIALTYLADKFPMDTLQLKEETSKIIDKPSSDDSLKKGPEEFTANPWCIYFLTFVINNKMEIMLSVRSDVEIRELYSYDIN